MELSTSSWVQGVRERVPIRAPSPGPTKRPSAAPSQALPRVSCDHLVEKHYVLGHGPTRLDERFTVSSGMRDFSQEAHGRSRANPSRPPPRAHQT